MNNLYLLVLALLFSKYSVSQTTIYSDRLSWEGNITSICSNEDFESFTMDVDFRINTVQCNGFTIGQMGFDEGFRNKIDVSPFDYSDNGGSNHAACYVNFDNSTEVHIIFDSPVLGFFADYYDAAEREILMQAYNSNAGMIGEYTFSMNNEGHGIISNSSDMPITDVILKSSSLISGGTGEGFGIDNISTACALPVANDIPTLSQWGIFSLFISIGIVSLVFIRQTGLVRI